WKARRSANVTRIFRSSRNQLGDVIRSLRVYQWVKNLLIFVPAFTSHTGVHGVILLNSALAFLAFSLCASAIYVINDLLDLADDRAHKVKRRRPLASGDCSISAGLAVSATSLSAGLLLGLMMSGKFAMLLLLYVALTLAYTVCVKAISLADVL